MGLDIANEVNVGLLLSISIERYNLLLSYIDIFPYKFNNTLYHWPKIPDTVLNNNIIVVKILVLLNSE